MAIKLSQLLKFFVLIFVVLWSVFKIILMILDSLLINSLLRTKRNRTYIEKLYMIHYIFIVLSIIGGLAVFYLTLFFDNIVFLGIIIIIFEIVFAALFIQHRKFTTKINKNILIAHLIFMSIHALIFIVLLILGIVFRTHLKNLILDARRYTHILDIFEPLFIF